MQTAAVESAQDDYSFLINLKMDEIRREVSRYEVALRQHPLAKVFKQGFVAKGLLQEYAGLQYVENFLRIPMLALMKDRVNQPRLKRGLTENILCQVGAQQISQLTLCHEFVEGLGISPYFGNFLEYSQQATQPVEIMNAVSRLSEGEIAGQILVAEAMVPALFQMALPAYERVSGVDLRYLKEHLRVDAQEHSQWIYQSVQELLENNASQIEIFNGIHLGGRAALAVPDALYSKHMRGAYTRPFKKT